MVVTVHAKVYIISSVIITKNMFTTIDHCLAELAWGLDEVMVSNVYLYIIYKGKLFKQQILITGLSFFNNTNSYLKFFSSVLIMAGILSAAALFPVLFTASIRIN